MKNVSPRKYYRRICDAIGRDHHTFENKNGRKSWKLQADAMAGFALSAMDYEDLTVEQRAVAILNAQGENFTVADVVRVRLVRVVNHDTVEVSVRVGSQDASYDVQFSANVDFYNIVEV